jgi:hypothetical protein
MCSIVYIYGAFGPVESSWDDNGDGIDALLFVLRALIPTGYEPGCTIATYNQLVPLVLHLDT